VGTDDGNIQVTQNGGGTWTNVAANIAGLPAQDLWVSRVTASGSDAATAYVTIDGHRSANFQPWVFKTENYGQSWTNIGSNLPDGQPVYVIKQDQKNPNLLLVGTEFGVFYTLNDGETWTSLSNNLPTVAVHDIVIHPRDADIAIATHGRGLWIMDDISGLQQATDEILARDAHLFENEVATQWLRIAPMGTGGTFAFQGENPTKNAVINYYLGPDIQGEVTFEISDITGTRIQRDTVPAVPGIGKLEWTMRFQAPRTGEAAEAAGRRGGRQGGRRGRRGRRGGRGGGGTPAAPGTYLVKMTANGQTYTSQIVVRADPMRND
jgi:hypothetical protein